MVRPASCDRHHRREREIKNLQHLLCFATVVETGSFTEAARALGSSKSWVSRSVSHLESELDVRLFYRTTRRCSVTEAGALLYENAKRILDLSNRVASDVASAAGKVGGVLRVSTPTTFGERYVLPLLSAFLADHPDLSIEMSFDDYNVELVAPGFDLMIRHGLAGDSANIARKLCEVPVILVASPDYISRRGLPAGPADLFDHDCVVVHRASRQLYQWRLVHASDAAAPPFLFRPDGRYHIFGHLDACLAAAAAGLGISIADPRAALPLLKAGQLHTILPDYRVKGEHDDTVVQVIYPHRDRLPPKVRAFIDLLGAHAAHWSELNYDPAEYDAKLAAKSKRLLQKS